MANDLVPTRPWREAPKLEDLDEYGQPWDRPPVDFREGEPTPAQRQPEAQADALRDAGAAWHRGDAGFAVLRETDAMEHRQGLWDWGDARTWLILAALFFGFLAFTALVYWLPQGRHAAPLPIRPY